VNGSNHGFLKIRKLRRSCVAFDPAEFDPFGGNLISFPLVAEGNVVAALVKYFCGIDRFSMNSGGKWEFFRKRLNI